MGTRLRLLLSIAAATLLCAGCAAEPKAPQQEVVKIELPEQVTMAELRDADDAAAISAAPMAPAGNEPRATPPRRHLIGQLMVFPRESAKLALALDTTVEPLAIDAAKRALWEANGFRVGQLPRERLGLFLGNAPADMGMEVARLYSVAGYEPLTLVDRINGAQRLSVVEADGAMRTVRVINGSYQLLLKMVQPIDDPLGPIRLDLVPHHRGVAAARIVPRTPQQRVMEGTSFMDLRLIEPLPADRVWVIWADLPPLAAGEPPVIGLRDEPIEADGEPAPQAEAAIEDERRRPRPSGQPPTLAEAMLSGRKGGQHVQLVVLIAVDER